MILKDLWAKDITRDNYLMRCLTETHNKVIKELHLENRWKFKWFMLFKRNREKYRKLYDKMLNDNKRDTIKFNMKGDVNETADQ